jgi:uncharacterized protein (TIGR02453 family)
MAVAAPTFTGFRPEAIQFLVDLAANNDRAWFQPRKAEYERLLKEPLEAMVAALGERLEARGIPLRADPARAPFRIYRDVRFSKDKSPYKTNVGIHFRHERAKDAYAPGWYLHIGPDEVFAGGGIWHPDTAGATRIREAIVANPKGWTRATRTGAFAKRFELGGDSLKRVPSWADPEHALADDLKRKDFFGGAKLSEDDVVAPTFVDEYAQICRAGAPLMRFLCDALEVPF